MGFFVFIILIIGIVAIVSASNSGKGTAGGYHGGYVHGFDEDEYEDYETRAAMGERDYFTDDPARDSGFKTNPENGRVKALSEACLDRTYYDSYYAQVADDAMMEDESAMEEMRGEFGDVEW